VLAPFLTTHESHAAGETASVCRAHRMVHRTAALQVCRQVCARLPRAVAGRRTVATDISCDVLRVGPAKAAPSRFRESLCGAVCEYAVRSRRSSRLSSSEIARTIEK